MPIPSPGVAASVAASAVSSGGASLAQLGVLPSNKNPDRHSMKPLEYGCPSNRRCFANKSIALTHTPSETSPQLIAAGNYSQEDTGERPLVGIGDRSQPDRFAP